MCVRNRRWCSRLEGLYTLRSQVVKESANFVVNVVRQHHKRMNALLFHQPACNEAELPSEFLISHQYQYIT